MNKILCLISAAAVVPLSTATPSFALDRSIISRIRQANTSEQLAREAEGIVVKQNALILKKLSPEGEGVNVRPQQ